MDGKKGPQATNQKGNTEKRFLSKVAFYEEVENTKRKNTRKNSITEVVDLAEAESSQNLLPSQKPRTRSVECEANFGENYPTINIEDIGLDANCRVITPSENYGQGLRKRSDTPKVESDKQPLQISRSTSFYDTCEKKLGSQSPTMDDKIVALKTRQQMLGDKINQLHDVNKKKDEEASAIRELIAECKENLNKIRDFAIASTNPKNANASNLSHVARVGNISNLGNITNIGNINNLNAMNHNKMNGSKTVSHVSPPSEEVPGPQQNLLRDSRPTAEGERVTCKVDLGRMKVRIRGPSEDLKQLDAAQLINLLDKFQCQELIINTGEEVLQHETDYFGAKASCHGEGEVPIFYLMHPGNIAMIAGIVMIAVLLNANLSNPKRGCRVKFLLNVLYLGSFAFHYGMVLWMSFIRGHSLSTGLMPDTFNMVDNLILPKYYSVCVFLSALTLYSFLATTSTAPCTSWPVDVLVQVIVGVATFLLELATISYVVPAMIKIREATDDFIGDDEDETNLPEGYRKNMYKLHKLNFTVSVANMLAVMFMGANMYYISAKLNIG